MKRQNLSHKYYHFYNSIRFKYMLYLLVSACVIFAVLLMYNYVLFRKVVDDNINVRSNEVTRHVSLTTNSFLTHIVKLSEMLELTFRDKQIKEEKLKRNLRDFLLANPEIHACRVSFEEGSFSYQKPYALTAYYTRESHPYFQVEISEDRDSVKTDDFLRVMSSGKPFFSPVRMETTLGNRQYFAYVAPIKYIDETAVTVMRGVLSVYISAEWFINWIGENSEFTEGFAAIIGPQAELIAYTTSDIDQAWVQKNVKTDRSRYIRSFARKIADNELSESDFSLIDDNRINYERLSINDWNVVVVLSDRLLFEDANIIYANLIKIGIAGLMLLSLIFFYIIFRISRPLTQLADSTRLIAQGNFDIQLPQNNSKDEVAQLNHSMQVMIDALKVYFAEIRHKEQMEGELRVAREIQKSIIPQANPAFPQLRSIEIYGKVQPAKEVGGDFFDYILYKDRYLIFSIGDVSGNGVPAALLMAIARTLFRANIFGINPGEIITRINKELCLGNETNMFVTLFVGVLDAQTGLLCYANAGHNYPFLKKADGSLTELDQTHGIPLGMLDTLAYNFDKVQMCTNDTLILYTDGVNEARRDEVQFLGLEKVKEHLKKLSSTESVAEITNGLIDMANSYSTGYEELMDDVTVMTVKYLGEDVFTMKINSSTQGICDFQRKLLSYCSCHKVVEQNALKINLAVEELLMNIISYAYEGDENKPVIIELSCNADVLKVVIKDMGPPFDILTSEWPREITAEDQQIGGWGLFLVRSIMDRVEYAREGEFNVVSIFKNI